MDSGAGKLYVCGTPVGNLADVSPRILETLKKVDLIACEDTRRTQKLLNYYQLTTPKISCHEHNEKKRIPFLIAKLKEGNDIALVSDAGMPGISDPGILLIDSCSLEGITVEVIPSVSALSGIFELAGLEEDNFLFVGFLPDKKGKRLRFIESLKNYQVLLVFFISPYKLLATLEDLENILGNRFGFILREFTKCHEEFLKGKISYFKEYFTTKKPKGEFTLLLEPDLLN